MIMGKSKAWLKMTCAQRRVAIAKDVIRSINAYGMRAACGDYLRSEHLKGSAAKEFEDCTRSDARKIQSNCTVCAVGALVLSKIAKFDDATWGDIVDIAIHSASPSTMQGSFSSLQLQCIEDAFELHWVKLFPLPEDRMLAIMQNIVDNKGDFKSHDRDYEIVQFYQ
jgi:hypothetical protein